MIDTRAFMSEAKFYEGYSRYIDKLARYETWNESVDRVLNMHRKFFKDNIDVVEPFIKDVEQDYKDKLFLGAQRSLQFGGDQLLKNHAKMYNCATSYADRVRYFQEAFWMLLSGAGVGVSIQKCHTSKLPKVTKRRKQAKTFIPHDSIEGWADCVGVLVSSFFEGYVPFPEYQGRKVLFDLSKIREKNSFISGGFKAPGPEPLRAALVKIEAILTQAAEEERQLYPIEIYDISMHIADAVISGGVRRSATIFIFDMDDEDMMTAKTGDWYLENPQRARSNNSVAILKDKITWWQFQNIMKKVEEFGEPGFVFLDDENILYNPCVEIGMMPQFFENGEWHSGWQVCNLTEINGAKCVDKETFLRACKSASTLGTLQAAYTDFHYLTDWSKKIIEQEALIGVSVTGWMNNPEVLLDEETMRAGATVVRETNKKVAKAIGINQAARTTTSKPSGNASVILGSSSATNAEHSPVYIRNVQMNKETEVAKLIKETNPDMVEESVWSANKTDYVVSFPIIAPKNSKFKKDIYGVEHLKIVKSIQQNWIESGTNHELCVNPKVRHNVSNTISVDNWDTVAQFIFENRESFAGISLLSMSGDRDYAQAPFTEVKDEDQIISEYGRSALFASGLIVDALTVYGNLWTAIEWAKFKSDDKIMDEKEKEANQDDNWRIEAFKKIDWNRRFKKFSANYFNGDEKKTEYLLKDVYLLHKFERITKTFKQIDWKDNLTEKVFVDVDTMAAQACAGPNGCEI